MDKAAILAELVELSGSAEMEPDEFTRAEFMEASGCQYEAAKRRLGILESKGVLTKRKLCVNGASCWVYRKVEANDGS
ncbi:unnamed protein product [marine sediment metagenome]|uniref:Uncharacterized protein n=1 Tax=marine sediment metagenome TaxID=412755 RepID=X0VDR6_9ZZZZ